MKQIWHIVIIQIFHQVIIVSDFLIVTLFPHYYIHVCPETSINEGGNIGPLDHSGSIRPPSIIHSCPSYGVYGMCALLIKATR